MKRLNPCVWGDKEQYQRVSVVIVRTDEAAARGLVLFFLILAKGALRERGTWDELDSLFFKGFCIRFWKGAEGPIDVGEGVATVILTGEVAKARETKQLA